MNVSVIIATYGDHDWAEMGLRCAGRLFQPSAIELLVHHDPNGTIASTRNDPAMDAVGDWLLFLDADDELAPGYLDAMQRAWEREASVGAEVLLTPAVQQVRKGRAKPPSFYPEVDLTVANWLVVGTLIERDLFMRVGGFSDYPHGFEDWSLWNKAVRSGARVVKVPKAIYIQHINVNSKHRLGWKDRRWQVETHQRVERELAAWTP